MKKMVAILLLLSLLLVGCCPTPNNQTNLQAVKPDHNPILATEEPQADEQVETTPATQSATEAHNPAETEGQDNMEDSQAETEPAVDSTAPATESTSTPTNPTHGGQKDDAPEETKPSPTDPNPTQPATESTEPPHTEPTVPATQPPTEPEPEFTEPPATEPEGCNHDWECVHHPEEGHWLAGIACDCGWETYGDPDELLDAWYAHVNSYTPAEALLEHGGYGSMDQWIVDKPAYDEWVCRHCGEPKP